MLSPSIRVLVADPHPLIRRGLSSVVADAERVTIVGEAADGAEVLALATSLEPDIVVLPLRMPKVDGLDVIRRARMGRHRPRCIALVDPGRKLHAHLALRAGASACVFKCISRPDLACLIARVHEGSLSHGLDRWGRAGHEVPTLREVDVLRRVGLGRSNGEIARELGITIETVKAHLKSVFVRLGARDRTHAAVLGYQLGIISRAR
ncbi:response regulator transcription factor [Luteibacter sp. UNCMF331Sha3.1]|uniref:response regulator transcription factor n=1 Tax=Luteibacter sp. UNCMF331Sha3.1 TaxID=1502760 RepID=UPI000B7E8E34|nr:response regulator transcription factor [Luteibacter sp. UNCMF331Sha3.1]